MRLVLDTNTAVSGLLWGGPPGRLIDAAVAGQVQLFTSLPLLAELRSVLSRPKFSVRITERATHADALFEGYAVLTKLVVPMDVGRVVMADPDDDHVLGAAIAAGAEYIVSGDTHLLALTAFLAIPIVTAAVVIGRAKL